MFVVFTLLALAGCGVLLTTEGALINKNIVKNFCSDQNLAQLTNKVEKRMNECYGGDSSQTHYVSGAIFSTNISNRVTKTISANGSVSFAHSVQPALNPRYYYFRVQLENTKVANCQVKVTTHVVSPAWNKHSINLEKWLNGEKISCAR